MPETDQRPGATAPQRRAGAGDGEPSLRFEVLGPVRAYRDGRELPPGTPQQRAILAALLLREGAHVSVDELVGAVWGAEAPATAANIARTYVSRLRRALQPAGGRAPVIESVAGGYVLPVSADTLDLSRFRRLTARAESARRDGDHGSAAAHMREALGLFGGTPLAGLTGGWAEAQRGRLVHTRLAVLEQRLAADLELGRHFEVAAELWPLVAEHPLREGLRELQMLALYRAGQRAEAFAVYQETRQVLDRELGVEPGPALRELHRRVLRADPALLAGPAAATASAAPVTVPAAPGPTAPAQLPADLAEFTGRAEEVRTLTDLLTRATGAPVVGVVGLGGVGKSSLAVHVAHRLRRHFPGGQVYAELGGLSGEPADPADVLAGFLRAFGVPADAVPAGLPQRAAMWRSVLADRRVLLVLDDAYDVRQLRHLLPGTSGSAAIVTGWRRMMDLPGTRWLRLGVLRPEESARLLERLAGAERMRAEPEASARLAAVCADHPMALRLVAARLEARPSWSVATVERRLLAELGDLTSVNNDCEVFHAPILAALRRLDPGLQRAFRLLAAPDVTGFSLGAAAAVLELPQLECQRVLESLVDAHLLELELPDRYRFVELVRLVARVRALAEDGPAPGRAAIERLARYQRSLAVAVDQVA